MPFSLGPQALCPIPHSLPLLRQTMRPQPTMPDVSQLVPLPRQNSDRCSGGVRGPAFFGLWLPFPLLETPPSLWAGAQWDFFPFLLTPSFLFGLSLLRLGAAALLHYEGLEFLLPFGCPRSDGTTLGLGWSLTVFLTALRRWLPLTGGFSPPIHRWAQSSPTQARGRLSHNLSHKQTGARTSSASMRKLTKAVLSTRGLAECHFLSETKTAP